MTATVTPLDIRPPMRASADHIRHTPILETASPIEGAPPLSLKLECLQATGSFKARGAFHNLLTRPASAAGCATASGGNHGAAVAFAARELGIRARVFVPEIAPPAKVAKIKAYGARGRHRRRDLRGGAAALRRLCRRNRRARDPPLRRGRDRRGPGPLALEWEEDIGRLGLAKLDTVLIAVGGGGLISGVAAWFQGRVKVVGVEPEGSRALQAALEANAPVDVAVKSIAANSLGAKRVGELNFEIAGQLRERRRLGRGHGDRRGPAPTLGRFVGYRRAGWRGGLRRYLKRRLSARTGRAGRRSRLRRQCRPRGAGGSRSWP